MKRSTLEQREIRKQLNELYRKKLDNTSQLQAVAIQTRINRLLDKLQKIDARENNKPKHKKKTTSANVIGLKKLI